MLCLLRSKTAAARLWVRLLLCVRVMVVFCVCCDENLRERGGQQKNDGLRMTRNSGSTKLQRTQRDYVVRIL